MLKCNPNRSDARCCLMGFCCQLAGDLSLGRLVKQIEKFNDCLDAIAKVLFLHHHSSLSASTPESEIVKRRLAFMGLAVFTTSLLKTLVPADKV